MQLVSQVERHPLRPLRLHDDLVLAEHSVPEEFAGSLAETDTAIAHGGLRNASGDLSS